MSDPDVLKGLKSNFPELYELLSKNQGGSNGLIFFVPKTNYYEKSLEGNINFYYNHIFQKSKFDETLYVNLKGKVLKSVDNNNTFISFLRWTKDMKFNIKGKGTNEDNILYFITDGICMEEQSPTVTVDKSEVIIEKFPTSQQYLDFYGNENFCKDNKKYQKAKMILQKFIQAMKVNNVLIKGQESSYAKMFQENVKNLIYIFSNVFKEEESVISQEFVDVFVYKELYDHIMNKIKRFYQLESEIIPKAIKNDISKFSYEELKLPKNIEKCDFSGVIYGLKNLENFKTSFEKYENMVEISHKLIEEVKGVFTKEDEGMEDKEEFMKNCWLYFISHLGNENNDLSEGVLECLIPNALFFKYFLIRKNNNEGKNDHVINCFVNTIEWLQSEVIKKEMDINGQIVRPYSIK